MADVASALTSLLTELETTEDQVQDLPGDAGLITQVMFQAEGNGAVGKPA